MTVKLVNDNGSVVEGLQFDGTQESAVGITVWAGSLGHTLQIAYRGGDNSDWTLTDPANEEEEPFVHVEPRTITAGGWALYQKEHGNLWLTQSLGDTYHPVEEEN